MATETAVAAAGLFKVTVGEFSVAISTERILGIERADRAGDCPVISLAELLRPGQEAPPHNGPVLLAEIRGERIGFRVDKVTPLPRATRPRICETPSPLGVGRYSGVAMLPDGPLPIVDLEGLLFGEGEAAPQPVGRGSLRGADAPPAGLGRLVVVGHFD